MLSFETVTCPYCGEPIEVALDASVEHQQYIEDCQVCCRPIVMTVSVDDDGVARVRTGAENDA